MADRVENVFGLRLTALEARAADAEQALKEHFVELQQFITSSLKTQADTLRAEWRSDLRSGLDGVRSEVNSLRFEMNGVKSEIGRLDHRLDSVEHKLDADHAATEMALQDILRRLPPAASTGLPTP